MASRGSAMRLFHEVLMMDGLLELMASSPGQSSPALLMVLADLLEVSDRYAERLS